MKRIILSGILIAGVLFMGNIVSASDKLIVPEYPGYNRLMVPKTDQSIKINADMNPAKWSGAAEVTGLVRYNFRQATEVLPEEQRIRFYLMYNDEYLYIAMRSKNFPEGALLKTDQKNSRDQASIVFYDHFEVQFSRSDDPAIAFKKHYYKFVGNHQNSTLDQRAQPSVGQYGLEWDSGAEYATRFSDKYWDMELAIPFKNMDEEIAPEDFETWIMWLVRAYNCQSSDFFMWGGKDVYGWDYMPRLSFHSNLVTARLTKIGEPLAGNLDLAMELINKSNEKQKVYFNLNVKDSDKEIVNFDKSVEIEAGKTAVIDLRKNIPNTKTTTVTITAWMDRKKIERKVSGKDKTELTPIVLYQQRFSLVPKDEKYVKCNFEHVKAYRESKLSYNWNAAYIRSANAISGEIDTDIDGIDSKFLNAKEWRLELKNAETEKSVFSKTVPMKNKKAFLSGLLDQVVPDGEWKIESTLLDGNGNALDSQSYSITVQKQEWEGYKGGINDDFVPPPYTPVKIDGNKLSILNRTYTLAKTGLPSSITTEGRELLAKPITLELSSGEKSISAEGEGFKITDVKKGKVSWTGKARLGNLAIIFKNHLEYDGSLFIEMELLPGNEKVSLDSLKLIVEFTDPLIVCKPFNGSLFNVGGGIMIKPEQKGIIWESSQCRPVPKLTGTFMPSIYMGTPARGLWWFAKGDRGWILDDKKSATVVRRKDNGHIQLEQCFVNKPAVIEHPRKISFMIQAVPPKPLPANWREVSWGPQRIFGSGGWGDGFYSFNLENKEDWKKFKQWSWHDKPVYVAMDIIGVMNPGFSAYCGEWTGNSKADRFGINSILVKRYPDKHWKNDLGIVYKDKWELRASNYANVDVLPSLGDCRVWCFEQGVKNGDMRGYWWDMNTYMCVFRPELGFGYIREDGTKQGEFNYFEARDMFKRMYHIAFENGIMPEQWHYTGGSLGAFQYGAWLVENYYYMFCPDVNLIEGTPKENWPIDAGKYTGCVPQMRSNFHNVNLESGFVDIKPARAALTLCFLNDFGATCINEKYRDLILGMLRKEGFLEPGVESVLHWDERLKKNVSFKAVNPDSDVLTSVYKLPHGKLLLVLGNMSKVGTSGVLSVNPSAFIDNYKPSSLRVRNLETGISVDAGKDAKDIKIKDVFVDGHDFKLLIIEKK